MSSGSSGRDGKNSRERYDRGMAKKKRQDDDRELTTAEAAAELGVTTGRIRQLVMRGQLDATKRGRDLFIRAGDVRAIRDAPERAKGDRRYGSS